MERITEKMLQARVNWLNEATNNPIEPYARVDGKLKANIGNYHLSGAYGGVCLHQTVNEGGGVRDVFQCGHIPKRELFNRICAYMDGLRDSKEVA